MPSRGENKTIGKENKSRGSRTKGKFFAKWGGFTHPPKKVFREIKI